MVSVVEAYATFWYIYFNGIFFEALRTSKLSSSSYAPPPRTCCTAPTGKLASAAGNSGSAPTSLLASIGMTLWWGGNRNWLQSCSKFFPFESILPRHLPSLLPPVALNPSLQKRATPTLPLYLSTHEISWDFLCWFPKLPPNTHSPLFFLFPLCSLF